MIEQFYLIHKWNPPGILIWVKVELGVIAMNKYSSYPQLQNWSLTIRSSLPSYPGHTRWDGLSVVSIFSSLAKGKDIQENNQKTGRWAEIRLVMVGLTVGLKSSFQTTIVGHKNNIDNRIRSWSLDRMRQGTDQGFVCILKSIFAFIFFFA